jgi:hypothetical protein
MCLQIINRAIVAIAAFISFSTASAQTDQFAPPSLSSNGINSQAPGTWQQQVVAGTSGYLTSVDLYASGFPGTFRFFVNQGAGWQTDADAFSVNVAPTSFSAFSVATPSIFLEAGSTFMIGIQGLGGEDCCGLRVSTSLPNPGFGPLYRNGTTRSGFVLALGTHIEPGTQVSPVPEADSVAMMACGLVVVFLLARRKMSASPNGCNA